MTLILWLHFFVLGVSARSTDRNLVFTVGPGEDGSFHDEVAFAGGHSRWHVFG